MTSVWKYAAVVTLTGAMALASATPSEARHGRNAALIGGFAAGALIGAAAANANRGYYYGPGYYEPGYAYEPVYEYPAPPVYVPGPYYYQGPAYYYRPGGNGCGGSPGSANYRPCN